MPARLPAAMALLMLAPALAGAQSSFVYVGGYTGESGGRGIMLAEFDSATGQLTPPKLVAEMASPSFLAINPKTNTLYAVGESGGGDKGGPVAAFRIDRATGGLTSLNQLESGGSGPCHIALDPAGEFAAVANYGGGSTALFRLAPDGKLLERTDFVQHQGKGASPDRQSAPHAHCCAFDPSGKFLLTADLGLDRVLVRELDRATGKLTEKPPVVFPPGTGPRHLDLSPDGKVAFVCGELDSTVHRVELDLAGGTSKVTQSLSTLPKPTPGNSTAECRLHPAGKLVAVSNRGHNSVALFKLDGAELTPAGYLEGGIKTPRNFNFDPSGAFCLVANQASNSIAVFRLDGGKQVGEAVAAPAPVCVRFLAK